MSPGGAERGANPEADEALARALADLQTTTHLLARQLGELGRASTGAALGHAPTPRRLFELAPPELRARLQSATELGLGATRDLADWLLGQMHEDAPPPAPAEVPIRRVPTTSAQPAQASWILTASREQHEAWAADGFASFTVEARQRARARELQPGDVVLLHVSRIRAFAGTVRVTRGAAAQTGSEASASEATRGSGRSIVATEPLLTLPRERWVPADRMLDDAQRSRPGDGPPAPTLRAGLRRLTADEGRTLAERLVAATGAPA